VKHHLYDLLKLAPFVVGQFGFDFGDLFATLESFLGSILEFLLQVVTFLWNVLVYVAQYIWAALNFVAKFFYTLALDVGKAFKWLWDNIVKAGLVKALQLFQTIRAWLQKVFGPILHWLKIARQWYDWAFNKYIKPVLILIQKVRQFLQIFRLLGFKWAARLDARLAQIENKIIQAYELLRQNLNRLTSWVQLVVDPTFLLRRNPLFGALIRSVPELRNLLLQSVSRPLTPAEQDSITASQNRYSLTAQQDRQNQYYSQGLLPPDVVDARAQFNSALAAYVNK
jgi:hypothetical protein